jgi:hypothetical protein
VCLTCLAPCFTADAGCPRLIVAEWVRCDRLWTTSQATIRWGAIQTTRPPSRRRAIPTSRADRWLMWRTARFPRPEISPSPHSAMLLCIRSCVSCPTNALPVGEPGLCRQGMKGRFEHAFESDMQNDPAHFSYACIPGSQFGKIRLLPNPYQTLISNVRTKRAHAHALMINDVRIPCSHPSLYVDDQRCRPSRNHPHHQVQRPQSASRMLGFKNLCSSELPPRPSTATRERDLVLQETGVYLDNVLARTGV